MIYYDDTTFDRQVSEDPLPHSHRLKEAAFMKELRKKVEPRI